MNAENFCFASKAIELSEHDNYIEVTNRLCYFDDANLNGVELPFKGYEEQAKAAAQTLVNQPVQAAYKKINGQDDLGGHEATIVDGKMKLGTVSVGTHTNVWISEPEEVVTVNGEHKVLPCLYATARIWTRYENVVSAVKRLFSSATGLNTSWEISTNAYEYRDGKKILTDYSFMSNCLLGSSVTAAYNNTSKAIALASEELDSELMIAEAVSKDIENIGADAFEINNKEDRILDIENKIIETYEVEEVETKVEETEVSETEPTEEVSETVEETVETPEEEISETKEEPEVSEVDTLNARIAELEKVVSEKDEAIIKCGEEIASLNAQISELKPFKEQFEKAEQERIMAEEQTKKDVLVASITKSGLITKEEIVNSEELSAYVEALDDKSLKAVLAERYMQSLEKETEVSEVAETKEDVASVNLNNLEDEKVDAKSIMRNYFGK